MKRNKKKIKIRQRILAAFSAVLFFSFLLTAIIFNIALRILAVDGDYNLLNYRDYWDTAAETYAFVGRAGLILVVLIGIMFIMAVIVTFFLSNSITRPIEKLGRFAQNIGSGDFSTNNFEFNDKELEELNTALNKSVKQLGDYDSEQKTFFQNASHELRTPLMSIKCYAEGISFGLMEPKKASETILQETDKLSELVSDLLYISKIDNITTSYTVIESDLVEIIRGCADRQQAVADKNGISFRYDFSDPAIPFKCVRELMSRAIDNLIANGIRYASSEILLSCHKKANHIEIKVADDGGGIEEGLLPRIFERFCKGKDGIYGIGLSIVKSIIDQHNGQIKVENSKGAVFTIILNI